MKSLLTKQDRRDIEAAALQSFLDSGVKCKRELTVVPSCEFCGHIPEQYVRYDDGTVKCYDRYACRKREEANQ